MEGVRAKLMKGAAWLTATRLLLNALGLLSTFILARLLSPSDFGIVAIATAILAISMSITDLSLGSALVQRHDLVEEHFHSVFTISLMRSLFIFSVIAVISYPLSILYHESRLFPVLIATGFISGLSGLASPKMVMLTRRLVFWQEFAVQGASRVLVFIGAVGCAVLLKNYWALIVGNLIGAVCSVILSYIIAPYLPRISFAKFRELFSFSFWLSLGDTVNTLNWKLDQLVLGYLVGKAQLGLYTVADNISGLPVRESTQPLTRTLFPAFSRIAHDPARLQVAYTRAQTLVCAIAIPVGFGFAVVADPVVRLFLGAKWLAAIPIIQILSATFAFQSLSSSLQPLAMATGATRLLFGRDVRTFLIRVPFIIGGFLLGGLLGVVIGRSISSFIGTTWNMALVSTLTGISVFRQFLDNARILIAASVMVVVAMLVQMTLSTAGLHLPALLTIIAVVLCGAATYGSTLLVLWALAGRPKGPETEALDLATRLIPTTAFLPFLSRMRRN